MSKLHDLDNHAIKAQIIHAFKTKNQELLLELKEYVQQKLSDACCRMNAIEKDGETLQIFGINIIGIERCVLLALVLEIFVHNLLPLISRKGECGRSLIVYIKFG